MLAEVIHDLVIEFDEKQEALIQAIGGQLKGIVAEITANRRTALGFQSTVDLTRFSTASLLAEYEAVSTEFKKQFRVGGILRNKNVSTEEEVKPVVIQQDNIEVGRLKGADITRKNS